MRINGNPIFNANSNLYRADNVVNKSIQRLSSSQRINSAGDDAAGLAVGTKLRTRVMGYYRQRKADCRQSAECSTAYALYQFNQPTALLPLKTAVCSKRK